MSRDPVLLPRVPAGFRLVEQDLGSWLDDRLAAAEAAGYAKAMAGAAGAFEEAALRLDADREEAVEALAGFATRFACEVARHLLRLEIRDQAHDIEAMVRSTLAESGVGRGTCVVHLNPEDAEALAGVTFRSGTEIAPDGGVPHGSVQVETPRGLVVRDVDACIRHAADRIYDDLRRTGGEASAALTSSPAAPDDPHATGDAPERRGEPGPGDQEGAA